MKPAFRKCAAGLRPWAETWLFTSTPGVDYAPVAFTPELRQENLHANDDLALCEE